MQKTTATSPQMMKTLSCPSDAQILRLQECCLLAGHWRVSRHCLEKRAFGESVLLYCVKGSGVFTLNGVVKDIAPGDLFFCPAGVEHGYGCKPETGWEIWWVHFRGSQAMTLCQMAGLVDSPRQHLGIIPELEDRFAELIRILESSGAYMALDASRALHCILMETLKLSEGTTMNFPPHLAIETDCHNLDELARQAGYSKYHFCRLFKRKTGLSPWRYISERKMEHAKELLLGTRLSIKEISLRLGFKNQDYFAKIFAKHTGVTPKLYRGLIGKVQ